MCIRDSLFEGRRIDHISALATKGDTFAYGDAFGSRIVDHHDIVVGDTLDIHGCDLGSSNRLANQGEDDVTDVYKRQGQNSLLASIISSRTSLATVIDGTVLLSVNAWSAFSYDPSMHA